MTPETGQAVWFAVSDRYAPDHYHILSGRVGEKTRNEYGAVAYRVVDITGGIRLVIPQVMYAVRKEVESAIKQLKGDVCSPTYDFDIEGR